MGWKQPIDTDIYEWFGDDHLARDLFNHLIMHSKNKDMVEPKYFKGKPYLLKRGQVIFGRNKYAKLLRSSASGTRNALLRLTKVYSRVTSKSTPDYTIINILDYDNLIRFEQALEQASDKQVTSKKPTKDTNKNVKKEKDILFKDGDSLKDLFLSLNKKIHSQRLSIETNGQLVKLKARLKNFSKDELIQAADNMISDPFMMGDNKHQKKYASLEYLLRSDENVRKCLENTGKVTRLMRIFNVSNLED